MGKSQLIVLCGSGQARPLSHMGVLLPTLLRLCWVLHPAHTHGVLLRGHGVAITAILSLESKSPTPFPDLAEN